MVSRYRRRLFLALLTVGAENEFVRLIGTFVGGFALAVAALALIARALPVRRPGGGHLPADVTRSQGCLIAVAGVLLGFFGTVGALEAALDGRSRSMDVLAMLSFAGYLLAFGGVGTMFGFSLIRPKRSPTSPGEPEHGATHGDDSENHEA